MTIAAYTTQGIGPDATIAFFVNLGFDVVAGDITAPVLTLPTGASAGKLEATGTVTTDEDNGTLSYYASTNSTEIAATIIANGDAQAVSATGIQNVVVIGLSAQTTFFLHYVHVDAASNESNVADSASFTTDDLGNGQGPKQGVELVIYFALSDNLNPGEFKANPTIAAGDFQISKDGVTFANLTNLPVVSPSGSIQVKATITVAEMTGTEHVGIKGIDQTATEEWAQIYIPIDVPTLTVVGIGEQVEEIYTRLALDTAKPLTNKADGGIEATGIDIVATPSGANIIQTRQP